MSVEVDYYFAPVSPWTYLGHDRFVAIAKATGARVRLRPADLGQVFAVSGGLPLAKRPPQRQAYRLLELRRFAEHLRMPINLHPAYFPVAADLASRLLVAVDAEDGGDAALSLLGRMLRAVWVDEKNIADPAQLQALLAEEGLPAARIDRAGTPEVQEAFEAHTKAAIEAGVFGAPSFVVAGELFWGQDRLDFVERRLRQA